MLIKMKKLMRLFFVIFIFFSLLGCFQKSDSKAKEYSKLLIDYIHQDSLNYRLYQADVFKWDRDYLNAVREYKSLIKDTILLEEERLYVLNQLTYCLIKTNQLDQAKRELKKIEPYISISDGIQADYNLHFGMFLVASGKRYNAALFFNEAYNLYQSIYPKQHFKIAESSTELGLFYWYHTIHTDSAIHFIDESELIFHNQPDLHQHSLQHLIAYSTTCLTRRDHITGLVYTDIALDLAYSAPFVDSLLLARIFDTKGLMLKKQKATNAAEEAYKKAISIADKLANQSVKEEYVRSLLLLYATKKDSVRFFEKYKEIKIEYFDKFERIDTNRILGYYHYNLRNYDISNLHYFRFLQNSIHHKIPYPRLIDEAYFCLAYIHNNLNNFDIAAQYTLSNIRLRSNLPNLELKEVLEHPNCVQTLSQIILLGQLAQIYTTQYVRDTNQIDLLKKAFRIHQIIDNHFFEKMNTFEEDATIFFLETTGNDIYSNAIKTVYQLYIEHPEKKYLEWANIFMERRKSLILYKELINKNFEVNPHVPSEKLKEIIKVAEEIEKEKLIYQPTADVNPKIGLFSLLRKQKKIFQEIKKEYQEYYFRSTTNQIIPSLETIQTNIISRKENILQFHIDQESIYSLFITKSKIFFLRKPKLANHDSIIAQYRDLLSQNVKLKADPSILVNYAMVSYQLFEYLVQPIFQLEGNHTNWVVIPDQSLHTIPLSSLITERRKYTSYKEMPFLIYQKNIKYSFSIKSYLWSLERRRPISENSKVLAYAYSESENSSSAYPIVRDTSLAELRGAVAEVQYIQEQFLNPANIFLFGRQSSRNHFLQNVSSFDLIHLGVHAQSNPQNRLDNRIIFRLQSKKDSTNVLYAHQLRPFSLNASLAVLNICESNYGKVIIGEGSFSLARAFFQAGVSQIIASFWKAEDITTERITRYFYNYLKKGFSPNVALYRAQLSYLKQSQNPSHPGFWAHLVCYN